jgi:hypothetical protein
MRDRGMSHAEIAEAIREATGYPVARSSVSAALSRHGDTKPLKKYTEEAPWQVRGEHQTHYAARMLRLLGRRRAGLENTEANDRRLNAWLKKLKDSGTVVIYIPESPDGFHRIPGEWDAPDLPVMKDFPPQS